MTDRPGLALGILTADCAPVLLADSEAGVVGAAHAGWKGAIGGVTDATLLAMEALGAQTRSYPRGDRPVHRARQLRSRCRVSSAASRPTTPPTNASSPPPAPGHAHFDLEAYVAHRLAIAGVRTVEAMGLDTYANEDRFYSFRRATHRGEPGYGRQISIIGIGDAI